MTVVFCSNFMNHHQYFFCTEMIEQGAEVYFVSTESLPTEQKKLGYHIYSDDFIIPYTKENESHIHNLVLTADAVIFGSKPMELYRERVNSGRLTFNFSERLFKKSRAREFFAFLQINLRKKYLVNKKNTPYVLCAGSYVASDYRRIGYPKNRFLKWGYFPYIPKESFDEIKSKKKPNTIIWVGRFISWKHPEYVLELAEYLQARNKVFNIKMIGVGEMFDCISQQIEAKSLGGSIQLIGAMSPEQVLEMFRESEIALITSDRNEGWGAVVNEALGLACATVACRQIGSVSYLIEDGKNGLIYEYPKKKDFFKKVEHLIDDPVEKEHLAFEAYQNIQKLWNYKVAAKRILYFIDKRKVFKDSGPLSQG